LRILMHVPTPSPGCGFPVHIVSFSGTIRTGGANPAQMPRAR
jgi:hypothetical protein